ncbi:uncharacterized protein LTR77_007333 [Saxophila tyrrhenica]|uniref:Uncharacterized protein n=1 Tax=Saxophila tyrrhenica TaxID=1690608 RepID=A0AAV9P7R1_9PEZI|nr:hypothetical protein LTR77_007333 [Saxophila tyrrhenica]
MLGSVPATASLPPSSQPTTSSNGSTPTSPNRPSRLRGLSYLRNYTTAHLHNTTSRSQQNLTRSTSTPSNTNPSENAPPLPEQSDSEANESAGQRGTDGWLPTVQGRSGLSRDTAHPTSSTEVASPERSMMARTRTASASAGPTPAPVFTDALSQSVPARPGMMDAASGTSNNPADSSATVTTLSSSTATVLPKGTMPMIRFSPYVDARSSRPALQFAAQSRTLKSQNSIVKVGRYSERDIPTAADATSVTPVGFKSKVVSRRHCEFWCTDGQWWVKDVKSSSGTFLNHNRLSPACTESRPYRVNDGDIIQLGIDFKGGEEVIFRCVKIRINCNRGWQTRLNDYNKTAHKKLLASTKPRDASSRASDLSVSEECTICLCAIAPCQALFVAPCTHVWHFKCIGSLLFGPNYPHFTCPNCRAVADLQADPDPPEDDLPITPTEWRDLLALPEHAEEDEEGGEAGGDEDGEGGQGGEGGEGGEESEEAANQDRVEDDAVEDHDNGDEDNRSALEDEHPTEGDPEADHVNHTNGSSNGAVQRTLDREQRTDGAPQSHLELMRRETRTATGDLQLPMYTTTPNHDPYHSPNPNNRFETYRRPVRSFPRPHSEYDELTPMSVPPTFSYQDNDNFTYVDSNGDRANTTPPNEPSTPPTPPIRDLMTQTTPIPAEEWPFRTVLPGDPPRGPSRTLMLSSYPGWVPYEGYRGVDAGVRTQAQRDATPNDFWDPYDPGTPRTRMPLAMAVTIGSEQTIDIGEWRPGGNPPGDP